MSVLAAALLRARPVPVRLVIFDCDGVLIDSEPVANRVTAEAVGELGWMMTARACQARFLGMSLPDMCRAIEDTLRIRLPLGWQAALAARLAEALGREAVAVPGAEAVLRAMAALGLDWRVASNSGLAELTAKFACTGLAELVAGRVWSAETMIARGGRGKPAPDLFLAAAASAGIVQARCLVPARGIVPAECLVIEDSLAGVQGAMAAGMACLGFCPHDDGAALRAAGAAPFHDLAELPGLLRLAMTGTA
ncbi:MAG: HAD family hydrolase [Acetobacteraceae bacterium]